jgi:hypothetical protein
MNYTDQQLLDRLKAIGGKTTPNKYLIIGVQSKADAFDKFDDKFYVFLGDKFIKVLTGTTNAGKNALFNIGGKGNALGTAVWKTDEFYEDLYSYGLHKGKVPCLRQVAPIKYYRDNDGDEKAEEQGKLYEGIIYANFHGASHTYNPKKDDKIIKTNIGGWSYACQVCNNMDEYEEVIELVKAHPLKANYALLKEF